MIIHTIDILKKEGLNFLGENESMESVLRIKEKIINYLKKGVKNTKEIEKGLGLKGRSTRKALFELEKKGVVKRIRKEKMKRKFGESDSWELRKNIQIEYYVPKGEVCGVYETFHNNNVYKKHYLLLKKEIILNETDLTALGFFQAEGSKKIKTIEVVNSEPLLISLFISFLEGFGVNKKDLSFRVVFNKKIIDRLKTNKKDLEEKSKVIWDKIADSSKYKYKKYNYSGTLIGELRKQSPVWGSLNVEYCSVLLKKFLSGLLNEAKNNLEEKEEIAAYLRGFFAGEAYVGKYDREIQIASIDLNELNFVKKLLEQIGIHGSISKKTSTSPPRIIITNLDSFLTLESIDIFRFHPPKKINLLTKILNYKCLNDTLRKELKIKLAKTDKLLEYRNTA